MGQSMPTKIILLFFILLSTLLITITLLFTAKPLYLAKTEQTRILNIQKIYHKSYLRRRNKQIPQRSIKFAQEEINTILRDSPIYFEQNSDLLENNSSNPRKNHQTLANIIGVLNHLQENVILEIKTYTNKKGSKQQNLKIAQQRADRLKAYINSRCKIVFISAIGYGEEIQHKDHKNNYLEITLKRIK
jgi:outer membrane protein OmpA-like peptidoglycan-associated protein